MPSAICIILDQSKMLSSGYVYAVITMITNAGGYSTVHIHHRHVNKDDIIVDFHF